MDRKTLRLFEMVKDTNKKHLMQTIIGTCIGILTVIINSSSLVQILIWVLYAKTANRWKIVVVQDGRRFQPRYIPLCQTENTKETTETDV